MSSIDCYKHEMLDTFKCPTDFDIVYLNPIREIPIYRFLENIPEDELGFQGSTGDLIVGGGSGEAEAMLITRKGLLFFVVEDFDDYESYDELVKSYWSATFAYNLGTGLTKLGWEPNQKMEFWLAERVISQLISNKKIKVPNIR